MRASDPLVTYFSVNLRFQAFKKHSPLLGVKEDLNCHYLGHRLEHIELL